MPADETQSLPEAAVAPVFPVANDPQDLWLKAVGNVAKKELVKQFPILGSIYGHAHSLLAEIESEAKVVAKKVSALLLVGLVAGGFFVSANAGTLLGSLTTITTQQTNSVTFQTNTASIVLPVIYVSNGNLTATNSYTGYFRYSFDGSTFFTNNSPAFSPTSSNSATYTISPQVISVPVYVQMLAVTNASANTGLVQVGAFTP